jgi:hypothetical protein
MSLLLGLLAAACGGRQKPDQSSGGTPSSGGVVATTFRGLGVAAAGIYYWFASPVVASRVGAGDAGTLVLRVGMLVLVAGWYWNARRAAVANGSQAP